MTSEYSNVSHPSGRGAMFYVGWVLSLLPALFMIATACMGLANRPMMEKSMDEHGYPHDLIVPIVVIELVCVVVYLIPQTAVLGALLLTAYLGGAVATHVRVHESSWFMPIVFALLFWFGLFFRDQRVRALLPLRSAGVATVRSGIGPI